MNPKVKHYARVKMWSKTQVNYKINSYNMWVLPIVVVLMLLLLALSVGKRLRIVVAFGHKIFVSNSTQCMSDM
jgi:hypothetical protein